jgi:hypothetical protein
MCNRKVKVTPAVDVTYLIIPRALVRPPVSGNLKGICVTVPQMPGTKVGIVTVFSFIVHLCFVVSPLPPVSRSFCCRWHNFQDAVVTVAIPRKGFLHQSPKA